MVKKKIRHKSKRYFVVVEGNGEVSFTKFISRCAKETNLSIHLDVCNVRGGGYEKMLSEAIKERNKKGRGKKDILIVDKDRSDRKEDSWTIEYLKEQCKIKKFDLIIQEPNLEGIFAKMFLGNGSKNFTTSKEAETELKKLWPDYDKPEDSMRIAQKFTVKDLLRMAQHDENIKKLLKILGFKIGK